MKNTMKVAVCISGQLRTYEKCYENLKKYILKPLNPDIFIQVWDEVGASHKESEGNKEKVCESKLLDMYHPKKIVIEERPIGADDELYGKKVPPKLKEIEPLHYKSALSMFYQINACNRLAVDYSKEQGFDYDVIIRIRPDSMFLEKIPDIIFDRISNNQKLVYFADYAIDTKIQVCDKFALGTPDAMTVYSNVWDNIEGLWKDPEGLNPPLTHKVGERLLKAHTDNVKNLMVKPFYLHMYNLRTNGKKVNFKRIYFLLKLKNIFYLYG